MRAHVNAEIGGRMRSRDCMRVLCSHGVLIDLSDGDESLGNEGTPFIRPGTGSDDELLDR